MSLIGLSIEVLGEVSEEDLLNDNTDLDEVAEAITIGLNAVIANVREKFPHYTYVIKEG